MLVSLTKERVLGPAANQPDQFPGSASLHVPIESVDIARSDAARGDHGAIRTEHEPPPPIGQLYVRAACVFHFSVADSQAPPPELYVFRRQFGAEREVQKLAIPRPAAS